MVAILHTTSTSPSKARSEPYRHPVADPFRAIRRPRSSGACRGRGKNVNPIANQVEILDRLLSNPALPHIYIDLSWTEAAKYVVATPESTAAMADLINRHPDRFLFGTDEVAPNDQQHYLAIYDMYAPLFARLTPEASEKFRKTNYARIFDEARRRVRAWERVHLKETPQ